MRAPHIMTMAASVAALVVAAPVLMKTLQKPEPAQPPAVAHRPQEKLVDAAREQLAKQASDERNAQAAALQAVEAAKSAMEERQRQVATQEAKKSADTGQVALGERIVDQLRGGAAAPQGAPVTGRVDSQPPRPEAMAPMTVRPATQGAAMPAMRLDERRGPTGNRVATFAPPAPADQIALPPPDHGRDRFESKESNPVKQVAQEPVSTFSIDVDTASYSFVRRSLNAGRLPPKDAVRVEEMINYFPYAYPAAESADAPFRASIQVFASPWNAANQLVHIGLMGYYLKARERPRANLVLLVDISGSMGPADRLPLLRNAFKLLVDNLGAEDTISIVTYANGSDVRLQPTKVAEKAKILAAIDSLNAGGSTHGAAGITDAYRVAEASFDKAAVNRVILATDGDWNVGITNRDELKGFVERKRQTGIFLSILGVGMGNHNDALMQALAQNGNGAAAYIDTLNEARKVLVDEASSTLFPIAKDVKIQLEFNPARVAEYRLVGYETRMLKREDFNNDKVDAGDVGSGHSVTAIYEITPVGAQRLAEPLRYQPQKAAQPPASLPANDQQHNEIGFLKLRYKLPKEEASRLSTFVIGPAETRKTIADASTEARFSVAVAAFGQLVRGVPYVQGYGYDEVIALANGAKGDDAFGYRAEFVNLVRLAKSAAASVGPR